MRGNGLFPRFLPILSRPIKSLLSHRYDTRSDLTMVGQEIKNETIVLGGNENDTKGSFDGSDDDELNLDEDEAADGFLSSRDNAAA